MNADGARQKRLTRTGGRHIAHRGSFFQIDPAWSPDGEDRVCEQARRIVSTSTSCEPTGSARSGSRRRVSTTRIPTWALDGQQIAFKRADDIYVHEGGRHAERTRSHACHGSDSDPGMVSGWKMDRVYSSLVRHTRTSRVSGSCGPTVRIRSVIDPAAARRINPAWSPDGLRIVLASNIVGSLCTTSTWSTLRISACIA